MDNQNNNNSLSQENQEWLDNLLSNPTSKPEIEADEQAVYAAGLTHPNDLELEKILSENWDDVDTPSAEAPADPIAEPTIILDPVDEAEPAITDITAEEPAGDQVSVEEPVFPDPAELSEPESEADTIPEQAEVPVAPLSEDEMVSIPAAEETAPAVPKKTINYRKRQWKRRSKRGYGLLGIPHLISTAIWLALIFFIGISLGRTLWVSCADLMAFDKENRRVTITITHEDLQDIGAVADKLGRAELIRYPGLFKAFAEATGKAENISKGTFTLNSQLDYNAMINAMSDHGEAREVVEIMFPEGYNCAQIFRLLEQKKVCSVSKLEQCVMSATANTPGKQGVLKTDYWFLEDVQWGNKYALEGYLFPDTYKFYTNDDPERVLQKFLDNFDSRFTDIMKEDLAALDERFGLHLSVHDVVTIASIIQKETSSASESYDIGSVFYNRLVNGDTLGSDATVYYAIGDYFGEKDELTSWDLETNSPYNTRIKTGLPPGAICSPGRESLYAALDPNNTNYYYFVYDSQAQKHLFSKTYEEHLAKLRELGLA